MGHISDGTTQIAEEPSTQGRPSLFKKQSTKEQRDQIIKFLKETLSEKFNVEIKEMGCGKGKIPQKVLPRQTGIYLLNTICGFPLCHAVTPFGCERTTGGYCCMVIEDKRDCYNFDDLITELETTLKLKWENIKDDTS